MAELLRTVLVHRTPIAEGVVDYVFDLLEPATLPFRPGQFVTLAVGKDADGRDLRRSYSLASLPGQSAIRLLLRLVPGGVGSAFFDALKPGDEVLMTGPHGFFVLDDHHPGDVIIGATGTGIAPILPMMAELARREDGRHREVFWGVRHEADLFIPEEVAAACAAARTRLSLFLSQPHPAWAGGQGRITAAILEALPQLVEPTFYLVGNGAMISELKRELIARGVNRKKQIRTEAFFD
jgi:ferredoxin-NADP reductase